MIYFLVLKERELIRGDLRRFSFCHIRNAKLHVDCEFMPIASLLSFSVSFGAS